MTNTEKAIALAMCIQAWNDMTYHQKKGKPTPAMIIKEALDVAEQKGRMEQDND